MLATVTARPLRSVRFRNRLQALGRPHGGGEEAGDHVSRRRDAAQEGGHAPEREQREDLWQPLHSIFDCFPQGAFLWILCGSRHLPTTKTTTYTRNICPRNSGP